VPERSALPALERLGFLPAVYSEVLSLIASNKQVGASEILRIIWRAFKFKLIDGFSLMFHPPLDASNAAILAVSTQ
jgi:hypothetical protein